MKKLCTLIVGAGLLLSGFVQAADAPAERPVLRIGARVFTEQTILAELTAQYLRDKGYQVQITGGLGSNLADPAEQLREALKALGQLPQTSLSGVSSFYVSDSLLPGQPRYTNAVAALDTSLEPLALLDALQGIENGQGRERLEQGSERTQQRSRAVQWREVPSVGRDREWSRLHSALRRAPRINCSRI